MQHNNKAAVRLCLVIIVIIMKSLLKLIVNN